MPDLSQNACFECRKVFKKPHCYATKHAPSEPPTYTCPECGSEMIYMGYKFRAPKKSDTKEWERIKKGIESGTDWTKRTIRKEDKIEKTKLSPQMRQALGSTKPTKT